MYYADVSVNRFKLLTGGINFRGNGEFVARSPSQIEVVPGGIEGGRD